MGKRRTVTFQDRMRAAAGVGSGLSFPEFLETHIRTDAGKYSLKDHEPFGHIIEALDGIFQSGEPGVEFSLLKGGQIGASTVALGAGFFAPVEQRRDVGYFFPTNDFAKRFDKTRMRPLLTKSKFLQAKIRSGKFRGTDAAMLHEFNGVFWYGLGLESILNAISIPLDMGLYDEVDVLPVENMEWSDDRFAHSDFRLKLFFSVGMSPGAGIDLMYQDSCQYKMRYKCPRCGKDNQVLEDLFPECVQDVSRNASGEWAYVCIRCGKPLDIVEDGRWVAEYPSRIPDRKLGWRLPQLIFRAVSLDYIMDRWEKAQKKASRKAKFNCSTLAKPDAGSMQPITDDVLSLARMEGRYQIALQPVSGPVFGGADTGDNVHAAFYERLPNGKKRWIWFEELDSDVMEDRCSELIRMLSPVGFVCDAKPLGNSARRLAYEFPGRVWLQNFGPGFKTEEIEKINQQGRAMKYERVTTPRDESLDDFTDLFGVDGVSQMMLPEAAGPHRETIIQMEIHLKNLRKTKEMDARGNVIYSYMKNVPNHFGMAMNSATIAEKICKPFGNRRKGRAIIV